MTIETATLGGGCFWCLEAVYLDVDGVTGVESGYAGGQGRNRQAQGQHEAQEDFFHLLDSPDWLFGFSGAGR